MNSMSNASVVMSYASVVKKGIVKMEEIKPIRKPHCECCRKEVIKTIWYDTCNLYMCEDCINFKEFNGYV
jgi:hypothetical protein